MLKCKICGKEFEANLDRHYVARDNGKTGLTVAISNNEEKLYDAFDCPACGCQVVVQERKRQYIIPNEVAANDEDEEDETDKKPICFGHYEKSSEECDCFCNHKLKCIKEKKNGKK